MVITLNWNSTKAHIIKKIKPDIFFVLLMVSIGFNAFAQDDDSGSGLAELDTVVAKIHKIVIEEDTLPVYSISVSKVGATYPCGSRFGISLQAPGYHIFSGESAYNATYVPDSEDIEWPDEGTNKNNQVYKNTFNRVMAMQVGTVEGSFGKRWTISSEEFRSNYSNLFDFELDGQMKLAGDYNNLFFEMLISIQELAKENDDLKTRLEDTEDRLAAIEAKLDVSDTKITVRSIKSHLKISPNPSDNGTLSIEYSISNKVNKASLYIFDVNGKFLYNMPIMNRGVGNVTQVFDLSAGVYFYQLVTDGYKGETEKLLIN